MKIFNNYDINYKTFKLLDYTLPLYFGFISKPSSDRMKLHRIAKVYVQSVSKKSGALHSSLNFYAVKLVFILV